MGYFLKATGNVRAKSREDVNFGIVLKQRKD